MVHHQDTSYSFSFFIAKRILDYFLSIMSLIVVIPLSAIIVVAIRLDSPGAAIFKQKRVGINGKLFYMYKFRSMYENSDQSLHKQHIDAFASGMLDISKGVKIKEDPRVTRVGRILRKTSLDELPQIINVLNGTMTIVGPRPLPVYEVEHFNLWHDERLNILPGITGYWQVYGRSAVSFNDQLRYDIHYVKNMSFWLDIKLIIRTFWVVFTEKGAG
jgi:lipopolysaccharide/colanic/teichoic acid biosynthesis glycosyltransferase